MQKNKVDKREKRQTYGRGNQLPYVCMVRNGDNVLMLNRTHGDFFRYIPHDGTLVFPENIVASAIREVKEETEA